MRIKKWTEEQFVEAVKNNISIAGVCKELGLNHLAGSNYQSVRKYVKKLKLDISHWKGQGYLRYQKNPHVKKQPLEEILTENSLYNSFHSLKKRLIEENFKEYKCEICGISNWLEHSISLQLHHLNGNRTDNRLENLQFLCPNCHSQTDNYGGLNKKIFPEKYPQLCKTCGEEKTKNKWENCFQCSVGNRAPNKKHWPFNWPSKEEVEKMVSESSLTEVGKKLGVSTVRNHLRKYQQQ
jgi:5-methylcytosine-specific restriction endonuclease McrA